jgi:hypothetical protein
MITSADRDLMLDTQLATQLAELDREVRRP